MLTDKLMRTLGAASLIAALLASAALLPAEEGEPTTRPADPTAPKLTGDLFVDVPKLLKLTDEQVEKLESLQEARDEKVEEVRKHAARERAIVAEARETVLTAHQQKLLEQRMRNIKSGIEDASHRFDGDVYALLTRPQRRKWFTEEAYTVLHAEYEPMELSKIQLNRLRWFCTLGARKFRHDCAVTHPYHRKALRSLHKQIHYSVLTPQQRKEYRELVKKRIKKAREYKTLSGGK